MITDYQNRHQQWVINVMPSMPERQYKAYLQWVAEFGNASKTRKWKRSMVALREAPTTIAHRMHRDMEKRMRLATMYGNGVSQQMTATQLDACKSAWMIGGSLTGRLPPRQQGKSFLTWQRGVSPGYGSKARGRV